MHEEFWDWFFHSEMRFIKMRTILIDWVTVPIVFYRSIKSNPMLIDFYSSNRIYKMADKREIVLLKSFRDLFK